VVDEVFQVLDFTHDLASQDPGKAIRLSRRVGFRGALQYTLMLHASTM